MHGESEILVEFFGDIKIVPRKIAEPNGAVLLDDARHGDRDSFNVG